MSHYEVYKGNLRGCHKWTDCGLPFTFYSTYISYILQSLEKLFQCLAILKRLTW